MKSFLKNNVLIFSFVGFVLLFTYRNIFTPGLLINTDLPYLTSESFSFSRLLPFSWDLQRGGGLGGVYTPFLWYFFVVNLPTIILMDLFHIPWAVVERMVLFIPFLLFAGGGMYFFVYSLTKKVESALLGVIVFLLNSYVLLIVAGGQMQIAIALSLIPFALFLLSSYFSTSSTSVTKFLFAGVVCLLCMYDLRIGVLAFGVVGIYFLLFLYFSGNRKMFIQKGLMLGIITLLVCLGLHMYWILPTVLQRSNPVSDLGPAFTSVESVRFFSFATFEYPFSLLHPLWPNNIFGKVAFFPPLFLLIPLLGFSPLLFKEKYKNKQHIIFASLLVIIGAFFAKGTKEPFGMIYEWLFIHLPGFSLFRDPTKFYTFIVTGYALLIPLGYDSLVERFSFTRKKSVSLFFLMTLVFLLPIYQAFSPGLGGIFQANIYPKEYEKIKILLANDKEFSRVLWLPQQTPYVSFSFNHPAVSGFELFNTYSIGSLSGVLKALDTKELLESSAVKYIILAPDKNLYLTDGRYDKTLYLLAKETLDTLPWVAKVGVYDDMVIYQTTSVLPHISLLSGSSLRSIQHSPWKYEVIRTNNEKGDRLIFSETFNKYWMLEDGKNRIYPERYKEKFMQFALDSTTSNTFALNYSIQTFVHIGLGISILSFMLYIGIIVREVVIWKKK